jgi:hypothetical protein
MRNGKEKGTFASRHITASVVSILSLPAVLTVAYLALLGIAIVIEGDPGGPLALPFGIILGFAVSIGYTVFLLFPATALAELFTKRLTKWRFLVQALFAFVLLAALIAIYSIIIQLVMSSFDLGRWLFALALFQVLLAIPLGVYWWTAKLSNIIIDLIRSTGKLIGAKFAG